MSRVSTDVLYDDSDESSKSTAKYGGAANNTVLTLYPERWIVLLIFSSLALLNNVVCYSFAPIAQLAHTYYGPQVKLGQLVSSFFLTYVIFSFPSSWFIERYGLRAGTVVGAWLQFAGALLRCLGGQWLPAFECVIVGQVVASLGQAFFVNPPPLVAAAWFGEKERTMATTIACNANTLGIAVVYTLAPILVDDIEDIPMYLTIIASTSFACAMLATLFFRSEPPTPPSRSQHSKKNRKSELDTVRTPRLGYERPHRTKESPTSFLVDTARDTWQLFHNSGFLHTVIAFSVAECSINTFSAFLVPLLRPLGFDKTLIGYLGTGFILACMIGSAVIGAYVDRTKKYTWALLGSMFGGIVALLLLSYLVTTTMPVAAEVGRHTAASHVTRPSTPTPSSSSSSPSSTLPPPSNHHMPASPAGLSPHVQRNVTHHHHVPRPEHALNPWPITICLLLAGFMIGPIQPIAIEVAAEVTYPAPESSAVAVQQVVGNLISAAFFPIMMSLKDPSSGSMEDGLWALLICHALSMLGYWTFNGHFKRLEAERHQHHEHDHHHRDGRHGHVDTTNDYTMTGGSGIPDEEILSSLLTPSSSTRNSLSDTFASTTDATISTEDQPLLEVVSISQPSQPPSRYGSTTTSAST